MTSPAVRRQVSWDTARLVDFAGSAGDFSVIDKETTEGRHLLGKKKFIIALTCCGDWAMSQILWGASHEGWNARINMNKEDFSLA